MNYSDKDTNKRPKPCLWSDWEPWSNCKLVDDRCIRQRTVEKYEEDGGKPCDMEKDKGDCLLTKCCQPGIHLLPAHLYFTLLHN